MSQAGKLYIDNRDAFATYGLVILEGGYDSLVQFPPMKAVDYVDWPEEDGIEPDLLNPVLDAKEGIVLRCACVRSPQQENLFSDLQTGAYHTFDFRRIGVTALLRLNEVSNLEIVGTLATFTMSLSFDADFVTDFEHYEGVPSILSFNSNKLEFDGNLMLFVDYEGSGGGHFINVRSFGCKIDNVDVSSYGIIPLEGDIEAIARQDVIKQNLKISSKYIGGQTYDGQNVRKKERDVALKFLMRTSIPSLFWTQYKRFLTDLVAPGNRVLQYGGKTIKFFYKSQTVNEFSLAYDNSVWCEFTLNVCFYEGD